ncbi:hypothetical protein O0L34_g15048 [Tuta absoluta]|nr:hypothetical protein O0L34_g15048 [Tuta absoluta]
MYNSRTARKMVLLFVLLVFGCAHAQYAPLSIGESKKMTEEEFRKIPDDPMADLDPTDDIPPVPKYVKSGESPAALGSLPKNLFPQDQYLEEGRRGSSKSSSPRSMLFNFQQIHDFLLEKQSRLHPIIRSPFRQHELSRHVPPASDKMFKEKISEFEPHSFVIKSESMSSNLAKMNELKPIVWSTCEDFKKGSMNFNPQDIVNIVWIPFYTWAKSPEFLAVVYKFTVPTQLQVYEYQKKFGPYLNSTIDWTNPKLFFEQDLGTSTAMLIAADRSGGYYMIFDNEVSEFVQRNKIILPLVLVRLKIVGEYLALMYCERRLTYIMAREGSVPPTLKDKREAAKTLNFRGIGRPLVRDEDDEQARRKTVEDQKRYWQGLKYLPTDPGIGYLDALEPKRTPTGRKQRKKGRINFKFDED